MNTFTYLYNELCLSKYEISQLTYQERYIVREWLEGRRTLGGEVADGWNVIQKYPPLKALLRIAQPSCHVDTIWIPQNTICKEYKEEKVLRICTSEIGRFVGSYGRRIIRLEQILQPRFSRIELFEIRN